jgi:ATP-dependent helicase/nuclease subunit B
VPQIECKGAITLSTPVGEMTVKAKSDRIDVAPWGLEVLDFKTGTPSTPKEVKSMFAAQLPVTALIVQEGGFAGIPAHTPTDLRHIRLGGKEMGDVQAVHNDTTVSQLVGAARETLVRLYETYANQEMPYLSKPRAQFIKTVSYVVMTDFLARRAEWANVEGAEE